jgi:hypothetical protein
VSVGKAAWLIFFGSLDFPVPLLDAVAKHLPARAGTKYILRAEALIKLALMGLKPRAESYRLNPSCHFSASKGIFNLTPNAWSATH